jgi:sulfite exporter TauE/SafE
MDSELKLLLWAAATLGFLHTVLGPDHYLPFVAISRSLGWSRAKTIAVTLACGLAHVLSSALLGTLGIALGLAVARVEVWESSRGELAAWFLIAFGLVYSVWGIRQAYRHRPHTHVHAHADGIVHAHTHAHEGDHVHVHAAEPDSHGSPVRRLTPWALFLIFVFGPCEPLIPILMYPAAQQSLAGVVMVTVVFGVVTLATMLVAVLAILAGLARFPGAALPRYAHALAGSTLLLCGLAMQFFSL